MTMQLALGKKPATPGAVKLRLANYLVPSQLPAIPRTYGHERLVGKDWGMLANDRYGCCVFAGAAHESMLWTAEALARPAAFTDANVLADYGRVTGFNPRNPASDQGTNMLDACKYRQRVGIVDAAGQRHQIGAYLALDPGDLEQLHAAVYLFDGVGIGVDFPEQWMDAFNAGRSWTSLRRPKSAGGHYITAVARRDGRTLCVSWGKLVAMTDAGYAQFNDETYAYLAPEKLRNGVDRQGFKLDELRADLAQITRL